MFTNQYEEHLASQPDESRWDGFDRGDSGKDECYDQVERIIGRMTNGSGQRVVILAIDLDGQGHESDTIYQVLIDGEVVFHELDDSARAITVARWWMDGCPA